MCDYNKIKIVVDMRQMCAIIPNYINQLEITHAFKNMYTN